MRMVLRKCAKMSIAACGWLVEIVMIVSVMSALLIEDSTHGAAGEAAVRDAVRRRGAGRGGAKMRSILGGPRILDRRFAPAGMMGATETKPSLRTVSPAVAGIDPATP